VTSLATRAPSKREPPDGGSGSRVDPPPSRDRRGGRLQQLRRSARPILDRPLVQDSLIAAVLTILGVIGVFAHLEVDLPEGGGVSRLRHMDWVGIALILLQTVPLTWRRIAPMAVLVVTGSAMLGFFALGYFLSFAALGVLVALYTVASIYPRGVSIRVGLVSAVVLVVITVMSREPFEVDAILAEGLLVGAAWFLGDAVRIRRGQVIKLEELADRLEHEREQLARAAVARERRVIARELHDVVAHNVSVIAAQAGAARRVFDTAPNDALVSLGSIEATAREALTEMRRLTGFLRTDSDGATDWSPQPGLSSIPALLEQVRDAGVDVTLRVEGVPRPIPASLDLTAYRITQEALTNVMKHAGRARTHVVVTYGELTVELRIEDEGSGLPAAAIRADHQQPFGHLGMRERVALFGGLLRVGRRPSGGFAVEAVLPIDGVAQTGTDVEPSR
jgi:signal transduction histidine kinase